MPGVGSPRIRSSRLGTSRLRSPRLRRPLGISGLRISRLRRSLFKLRRLRFGNYRFGIRRLRGYRFTGLGLTGSRLARPRPGIPAPTASASSARTPATIATVPPRLPRASPLRAGFSCRAAFRASLGKVLPVPNFAIRWHRAGRNRFLIAVAGIFQFQKVGDIQKGIALQTNIHKRRLHAGQHARHAPFVNRTGQGVFPLPLQIDFRELVVLDQPHLGFVGSRRYKQFLIHSDSESASALRKQLHRPKLEFTSKSLEPSTGRIHRGD